MKFSKQIGSGLLLSCLLACGTQSPPPQVVRQKPDPAWTEQVPVPQLTGNDNAALAGWAKALREALDVANANLAAIKQWVEGQQ